MSDSGKQSSNVVKVFDLTTQLCVWSRAGVSERRICHNAFDCISCSFDKKLKKEFEAKTEGASRLDHGIRLMDKKRYGEIPFEDRKCRHMWTGLMPLKYCVRNFQCSTCEYDQMIEDLMLAQVPAEPKVEYIAGFAMADQHYFHRGHAWARLEYGGWMRVGLDDFALRLLGPVDQFQLPQLGAAILQGQPEFGLTRGDKGARVLSPVEGIVGAVNPKVKVRATLANASPYGEGWLFMVKPLKLQGNLRNLFYGEEAQAWLEEDTGRLKGMLQGAPAQKMAATGGRAAEDIYGLVPDLGWEKLVKAFLLT
jgi:glycine cleavage system H lipoate-binding protein